MKPHELRNPYLVGFFRLKEKKNWLKEIDFL